MVKKNSRAQRLPARRVARSAPPRPPRSRVAEPCSDARMCCARWPWPLLSRRPGLDDDDVTVRLEDQQRINQFGRLNGRMHDLEDDIKAKNSEFELLDDAANEIILADDDEPVR